MDFNYSPRTIELQNRLRAFMDENVYPAETAVLDELRANAAAGKRWAPVQVIERLKSKARDAGLQVVMDACMRATHRRLMIGPKPIVL